MFQQRLVSKEYIKIFELCFVADEAKEIADCIFKINELSEQELMDRIQGQQEVIIRDNDNVTALKNVSRSWVYVMSKIILVYHSIGNDDLFYRFLWSTLLSRLSL